jgi:16S rRNA G527 N7-methylase RsmG
LPPDGRVLDLGSGGGVPGLVVATFRPEVELTLL